MERKIIDQTAEDKKDRVLSSKWDFNINIPHTSLPPPHGSVNTIAEEMEIIHRRVGGWGEGSMKGGLLNMAWLSQSPTHGNCAYLHTIYIRSSQPKSQLITEEILADGSSQGRDNPSLLSI